MTYVTDAPIVDPPPRDRHGLPLPPLRSVDDLYTQIHRLLQQTVDAITLKTGAFALEPDDVPILAQIVVTLKRLKAEAPPEETPTEDLTIAQLRAAAAGK